MGACASKPLVDEDIVGGRDRGDGVSSPRGERAIPSPEAKKAAGGRANTYQVEKNFATKSIVEGLMGAYSVVKLLGSGAEGNTYLVEDDEGKRWAIKLVKLPLPTRFVQAIFREIKLQSELGEGHVNIITPEEVVLMSHYLGLVMEWAPGGSLTTFITERFMQCKGVGLLMSEDEARYLFRQLVGAVDFMHRNHVAHRDLKLDNTLLTEHNPPHIKLCDFGFARGWGEDSKFTTVIGTPDYMSPQITAAKMQQGKTSYDGTKADIWAMGVLLCVCLIGKFPFEGDSVSTMGVSDPMKKIYHQQHKSTWSENSLLADQLPYLSSDVRNLLDLMFEVEEAKRLDINGIKAHPWVNRPITSPTLRDECAKIEAGQAATEKKAASGAYRSKTRDAAISNLIKMAASEEFRRKATEPVTEETTFEIWSRINLRTALDQYPVFDKKSLQAMMSYSGQSRPGSTRAKK